MKILIASDLHGSAKYAKIVQQMVENENIDYLVLLGDLLNHGPRNALPEEYAPQKVADILNEMASKIIAVRGNCDSEVDQMLLHFPIMGDYATLLLDGVMVFATHGHIYNSEKPLPVSENAVCLYGHTHIGTVYCENGVTYLNPGSLSIPKDGFNSYMIYENNEFKRYSVDGELLSSWSSV